MHKLADGTWSTDYKVGDRFVVVGVAAYFERGQVITLSKDDESVCPWFDEGEKPCHWCALKAYKPKGFTKSDLKDGMVVTLREGTKHFILNRCIYTQGISQNQICWYGIGKNYNLGLSHRTSSGQDIMKVEYMDKVLWEREEETPEQKEIKRLQGIIKEAQDALNVINTGNNGECDE